MKRSYIKGIIGALLGGIIATIPWVLAYVYLDMILSILAIIVAIFALKGYQLFKGKVSKYLPIIITVIALISITVATFIAIPCLLILEENLPVTLANFKLLYSNSGFITALIGDYAISILFTILGISGVVTTLKNQIKDSQDLGNIKVDLSNGNNKKDRQKVKDLFLSKNAINENNAITIDDSTGINMNTLNLLVIEGVIIKTGTKYFYSLEANEKATKKNKKVAIITFIIMFLLIGIPIVTGIIFDEKETILDKNKSTVKDISYSVPNTYVESPDEYEENSWYYLPKEDLSGYSGYLLVYYFDSLNVYSDEWVQSSKYNFESHNEVKSIKSFEHFKNKYSYDVVMFDLECDGYDDTIYYIFGNKQMAVIEIIDYDILSYLHTDAKDIVDNLKWNKELIS